MLIYLKTIIYKAVLLSMVLGLLGFTIALAASGGLDTTFSGDGRVVTYPNPSYPLEADTLYDMAIQPNGKVVIVGASPGTNSTNPDKNFAIVRYNKNGSLDTTFSGDGRLISNFGGFEEAYNVAVQSDGKILVAGAKCNSIAKCFVLLVRYNTNGTFDTTFSGDGKQLTGFGAGVSAGGGLAIQPNGKIVVGGWVSNSSTDYDYDFAVFRYLSNGNLDPTFSGDGRARINFGEKLEHSADLVLQSDGKIVVAGSSGGNFAVARLNANGTPDITFSGNGKKVTDFGGDEHGNGVALQPDGKIVVVGNKYKTSIAKSAIARYNTNGNLDATFNGTGKKEFSSAVIYYPEDVIVQSDGKILVLGSTSNTGFPSDFGLIRLLPGGGLDTSFSGDGKIVVNFVSNPENPDHGVSIAIQPSDGKYVLAGMTYFEIGPDNFYPDFALARVLP